MNQRPTRAPPPTTYAEHTEATFDEVERPNNLPARAEQHSNGASAPAEAPVRDKVTLPTTGFATLAAGIAGVMAEIKPVAKAGWNDFHKYNYARMQDLMGELTPLMGKHGIVVFQNELDRSMFDDNRAMAVRYEFTIVHKSGEIWPERPVITGVSMCRTSNGKYDDKAFNKCHTSARKYFLLSLFQIPTDDEQDADADGGSGQQRPRRSAPPPDGKAGPQLVPIISGELPSAWAERFVKAIAKATVEEVNAWYDANFAIFEKIKKADAATYDRLIEAMDAREKAAAEPAPKAEKPDPISSGVPGKERPRAAPAKAADTKSTKDAEWFVSLQNAFGACEDVESLAAEQARLMTPQKGKVSDTVWNDAVDLVRTELQRIEDGEAS